MKRELIFLAVMAYFCLVGMGISEPTVLSAVGDVYIDFVNCQVYNGEVLKCEMDLVNETWPVAPLIKFNVSDFSVSEDDVAILVLKADSIQKGPGEGPGAITIFPADTNWTEESDFLHFVTILNETLGMVEDETKIDYSKTGVRFDNGDETFAFEVSKHLKDATSEEIAFMLVAVNDNLNYQVDFLSKETGSGPHLLIIPYPSDDEGSEEIDQGSGTEMEMGSSGSDGDEGNSTSENDNSNPSPVAIPA